MKKFLKFIFIFLVIIIFLVGGTLFIFKDKLSIYKNLYSKYINLTNSISNEHNDNNSLKPIESIDYKDIEFKNTNGVPLTLDLYSAKKTLKGGAPVIIYVHGGSWIYGDKSIPEIISPILQSFQEEGYSIISTSYELLSESYSMEKQIADVKDTIRWVYKNKDKYNFNTNKIGLIGISSGAHLSLMAGFTNNLEFTDDTSLSTYPSNVNYIIDLFGPTDLSTLSATNANLHLTEVLNAIPNQEETIVNCSPINYINNNLPNTLIIHSKDDPIVPYENSERLYNNLLYEGNKSELILFESGGHDLTSISDKDAINLGLKILNFIVKNT